MSEDTTTLDHDLHAYVDGELDAAGKARVEARLVDDPALAAQLAEWSRQNAALRAGLMHIADEPVPERLKPDNIVQATRSARMRVLAQIAASVLLIAMGGAGGWLAHDRFAGPQEITFAEASDLVEGALAAHRVYTVEVRHPVEVGASEEDHLVKWLSKRLGAPLVAPDLSEQDFALVGGRLLPTDTGKAAAQFMYENKLGQRITLYFATNPDNRDTSFRMAEADGVNVFYWLDGPLGCAVAGPLPREDLIRLARIAYEQIDKRLEAG